MVSGDGKITLPHPLRPALRAIAPFLLDAFGDQGRFVLGGGTVLAALWGHRVSTDLDFFVHGSNRDIAERMAKVECAMADDPAFKSLAIDSRKLKCFWQGAECTVFSTPSLTGRGFLAREGDCGVPLEPVAEILAKKLSGRVMGLGDFKDRDFYDLCVASELDRDAYDAALGCLDARQVGQVADAIKAFRFNPPRDDKPILSPRYHDLSERLWIHAHDLLTAGSLRKDALKVPGRGAGHGRPSP